MSLRLCLCDCWWLKIWDRSGCLWHAHLHEGAIIGFFWYARNVPKSIFTPESLLHSAFRAFWRGLDLSGLRWKESGTQRWSARLWVNSVFTSLWETDLCNVPGASEPEVWAWILLNQRWTRTAACVSSLPRFHLEKHRNERHLFNMSLPLSSKSPTERKLTETSALAEDQCRGRVVGPHVKQTRPRSRGSDREPGGGRNHEPVWVWRQVD